MLTEAFRQYSEKVTLSRQRKLNNAECIVQIKREISLAKACLICKHRATFLENHELSRAALIRERCLNRVNTANTHTTHNFSSRSDGRLTLEASALKLLMVAIYIINLVNKTKRPYKSQIDHINNKKLII